MCQNVTEDIARYIALVTPSQEFTLTQDLDVPKDEAATELSSICYTVPTTDVQHKIIPERCSRKKFKIVGICVNC
jgi:hypothetical protein